MTQEIKQAVDGLAKSWEDFKALDAEMKSRTEAERKEVLDRVNAAIDEATAAKKAAEDAIVKAQRMQLAGGNAPEQDEKSAHAKAFVEWMRAPRDSKAAGALQDIQKKAVFTAGTGGDAAGGYAVPEVIASGIEQILMDISPIRQVARVVTASSKDFKVLVDVRGASTGWVGEKGARSETNTPQLAEVAPTFGTLYAYPQATEESLQDVFFNVQQWLTQSVGEQMAKAEGDAFTDGDGSNKPTGFLAGTKVATGDATRTFGQLQYIPTGKAGTFGVISNTSPVHYPADCLFDTIHALKAGYRSNARWMMNKATLGVVRKFKDAEGNYIWVPGIEQGAASSLLGFPVVESEEMADIGANTYPVAFGDFRAGYLICDLVGMRMTVDEVTTPGYIKFYLRRRVGGKLLKDEAIKLIKCAAS